MNTRRLPAALITVLAFMAAGCSTAQIGEPAAAEDPLVAWTPGPDAVGVGELKGKRHSIADEEMAVGHAEDDESAGNEFETIPISIRPRAEDEPDTEPTEFDISTNLPEDSDYPFQNLAVEAVDLLVAELTGEGAESFPHLAGADLYPCCTEVAIEAVALRFGPAEHPVKVFISWTGTDRDGELVARTTESLWWWTPEAWQSDQARLLGFGGRPPYRGWTGGADLPPEAPIPVASGPIIWVSVNGNDGNPGTEAAPLRSIQTGVNRAGPGTTINVMDGFYTERVMIRQSGNAEAWIILNAAPGHSPHIQVNQGEAIRVTGSYVAVNGFIVEGVNGGTHNNYGYGILFSNNTLGALTDSHHVFASGNRVFGFSVGGIVGFGTHWIVIHNNEVYGNANWGPESGSGISLLGSTNAGGEMGPQDWTQFIVGNLVYENEALVPATKIGFNFVTDGNCIILDGLRAFGSIKSRTLIAGNVAHSCGGRGLHAFESDNVDIFGNLAWHNGNTPGLPGELSNYHGNDNRWVGNVIVPRPGLNPRFGSAAVDDGNLELPSSTSLEAAIEIWRSRQ